MEAWRRRAETASYRPAFAGEQLETQSNGVYSVGLPSLLSPAKRHVLVLSLGALSKPTGIARFELLRLVTPTRLLPILQEGRNFAAPFTMT